MGASVQFYGTDSVLQAAEPRNCSCWGIYINGKLFTKFEDADMPTSMSILAQNLEVLEASNSSGIYTIKFFETDNGKPVKVTEKSVCDGGSFNFKLIDPEERDGRRFGTLAGIERKYEERIKQLEDRLAGEGDDEPEEKGFSLAGLAEDLIKNPAQLGQLINIGRSIFGMAPKEFPALGSIGSMPEQFITGDDREDQVERLGNAIDILEKNDPALPMHLEKLAKMATEKPEQFKSMLSMLEMY